MTIAIGEPSGSFHDDVRDLPAALAELGTAHVIDEERAVLPAIVGLGVQTPRLRDDEADW